MPGISSKMIAPCGMNCGICSGHLRTKNHCPGCNLMGEDKSDYCRKCIIRNCETIKSSKKKFCFICDKYPCKRLKALDKRYRTKYHMSMLENLDNIKKNGIRQFVRDEMERWACADCGGTVNVHKGVCSHCGKKAFS